MNLFDRVLRRSRIQKDPLPHLEKWIAHSVAWQPATDEDFLKWKPTLPNSGKEAMVVLFLTLFRPEWESWEIIDWIKRKAYGQRYQGQWNQVQEILEQDISGLDINEQIGLFIKTEDDFFGNFLVLANKILRRNPYALQSQIDKYRTPKKKQRRRGYQDHGYMRPSHQRGRNLPDKDPGIDRRDYVKFKPHFLKNLKFVQKRIGDEPHFLS